MAACLQVVKEVVPLLAAIVSAEYPLWRPAATVAAPAAE